MKIKTKTKYINSKTTAYLKRANISKELFKVKVDYSKMPKLMSEENIKQRYEDLGITYISNDTIKAYKRSKDNALKQFAREYQHRDRLIKTGQYEKARFDIYVNTLIRELKKVDNPLYSTENIIKNLKNLNYDQLRTLMEIKKGEKGAIETLLPDISTIYTMRESLKTQEEKDILDDDPFDITDEYNVIGQGSLIEEDVKSAFKMANLPYYDYTNEEIVKSVKRLNYLEKRKNIKGLDLETVLNFEQGIATLEKSNDPFRMAYARIIKSKNPSKYKDLDKLTTKQSWARLINYYRKHPNLIRTSYKGTNYILGQRKEVSRYIVDKIKKYL